MISNMQQLFFRSLPDRRRGKCQLHDRVSQMQLFIGPFLFFFVFVKKVGIVSTAKDFLLRMDKKSKSKLIIAGAIEAVFVIFALVVSVIVAATYPKGADAMTSTEFMAAIEANGKFIAWFQENRTRIFLVLILPMLLLLAVDVTYLVIFATKKENKLSEDEEKAIEERAKREAREELMREIMAEEAAKAAAKEALEEKE